MTGAIARVWRLLGMLAGDELVIHHVSVVYVDGLVLAEDSASRYAVLTRDGGNGPDASTDARRRRSAAIRAPLADRPRLRPRLVHQWSLHSS